LGIFWDITERKRAEVELQNAKESLNLANIELQAALAREQRLARTDALTSVNNRRYIFELAAHELSVAVRYHQPLSVLMFDVDHFKKVNDTFGHAAGDRVLQRLAQVVCREIRSPDVIGRYGGGDEFVILLPQTGIQEAKRLAERIRASVSAMRVDSARGQITLTISIGIAELVQNDEQSVTVKDLFSYADQALYLAKRSGRNCIRVFGISPRALEESTHA
jgi:diguanylate cyclase (GGDEF)-like protein